MPDDLLFSDRPIHSATEDLLGRASFAKTVAASILNWRGSESLTIALSGEWGTGKSSVKNMMVEAVKSAGFDSLHIVEFNPWKWATQHKVAEAFFHEISIALRRVDRSTEGKRRAKRWEIYGGILTIGAKAATTIADVVPSFLAFAALLGFFSLVGDAQATTKLQAAVIGFLLLASAVLKFGGQMSIHLANLLGIFSKEKSIEELKKELKDDLDKLKRPIVVIVDDIDRLNEDETKLLFQHIKANADFPNLIYLLLYQKDIVEKNLSTTAINGRDYLEKIVNLQFDIPFLSQSKINNFLFSALDRILSSIGGATTFDKDRWGNIYIGHLQNFFINLRSVKRFISTLSVHVEIFRGHRAFEVNSVDLIAIETLRVFEPEVYQAIKRAKGLLTGAQSSRGRIEEAAREVSAIIDRASERSRPAVRGLLRQLFPPINGVLGGTTYGSDWQSRWTDELRICSPSVFDRYFAFGIPDGDISQSDFSELIEAASDREAFVRVFMRLGERGLLDPMLMRLDGHKQKIPLSHASQFLPALFDIGDALPEERRGFFELGPHMHVVRTALWYLRLEPTTEARGKLVIEAMRQSTGLSVVASLISGDIERRAKPPSGDESALFTDQQLEEAKQLWVDKAETNAKQRPLSLLAHSQSQFVLHCWRSWGSGTNLQQWTNEILKSDEGLLTFLVRFTNRSLVQSEGDFVTKERWYVRLKNIEDYVPLESITSRLSAIPAKLMPEQERAVAAYKRALERRSRGQSDDAFPDTDED